MEMEEVEQSLFLLGSDIFIEEEFLFTRTTFLGLGRDSLGIDVFDVGAVDKGTDKVHRVNALWYGDGDVFVMVVMVSSRLVMIV